MSEKEFINFYEDGKIVGVADDNDIWLCENGSIVDLLNEQEEEISYWKHRVSSLLWILSQFDNEKVKKLLEELDEREEI